MSRFSIGQIALAGMIAALYVVLSLAFAPISFGVYQVRVAEALTVLPFLLPAAIPGLSVGCLLANVFGNVGWLDIVIGPVLTLAAALVTRQTARLSRTLAVPSTVLPLGLMFFAAVFLLNALHISGKSLLGVGLAVVAIAGAILLSWRRWKPWLSVSTEWRGIAIGAILTLEVSAVVLLRETSDTYFIVCGTVLLLATLGGAALLSWSVSSEIGPNVLLAPLAPVIFNAFGVSVYLAPIMGVDYWFAVQMVGVGELIACYVLGLPLLVILRRHHVIVPAA